MLALGPAAQASEGDRLLDRYRPILAYDHAERFFATSVEAMAGRVPVAPHGRAAPVVYGRATPDGRRLQYWLFFEDNPQDRGLLATGRHAGDWELVQLRLDGVGRPRMATLSEHAWANGCAWTQLRHRDGGPVVFVANGSHALYSTPGDHDRPWPDPTDEAGVEGVRARPPVERIDDRSPVWVRWPGRWGESRASWVPGEQSSPRGPRFAGNGAWADPAAFERGGGCPGPADPPPMGELISQRPTNSPLDLESPP